MKLLVTGGAGFIGANFVHYIRETYPAYKIVVLDALTYAGNLYNLQAFENDPALRFVKGNITDQKLVQELVDECDIVVHFAAESHVDRSITGPEIFIETNVVGTHILLEAARKTNTRFHHVSTDEVFGALGKDDAPFHEQSPYDPRSPYSASKAGSDHLVRAYFHTYGLPITISNCSNNYGPYHFPEKLIPLAITNVLEGEKIPIYGQGEQVRDWLHVRDHCRAIDVIIHQGTLGETYCVGGQSERTNLWIAKKILTLLEQDESQITSVADRHGHDFRYAIDTAKIARELGWQATIDLEQGLAETVTWFTTHPDWWQAVKDGRYRQYQSLEG